MYEPDRTIFNPLDAFLSARRLFEGTKQQPKYAKCHSLTQEFESVKTRHMERIVRESRELCAPALLFTWPAQRCLFRAGHVLARARLGAGPVFLQAARCLAAGVCANELAAVLLRAEIPPGLELRMLGCIGFRVGFLFFEDFLDSALVKALRGVLRVLRAESAAFCGSGAQNGAFGDSNGQNGAFGDI